MYTHLVRIYIYTYIIRLGKVTRTLQRKNTKQMINILFLFHCYNTARGSIYIFFKLCARQQRTQNGATERRNKFRTLLVNVLSRNSLLNDIHIHSADHPAGTSYNNTLHASYFISNYSFILFFIFFSPLITRHYARRRRRPVYETVHADVYFRIRSYHGVSLEESLKKKGGWGWVSFLLRTLTIHIRSRLIYYYNIIS